MQMLHYQHQKPGQLFVTYDSASRPCLFMKPSTKPNHFSSVGTLASCINDTTEAAALAHRAATGAALSNTPALGTPPQYTPGTTSNNSSTHGMETAAESAWALAAAAATSVSAIAGNYLNSSSSANVNRPAPSAPLASGGHGAYIPAQYHAQAPTTPPQQQATTSAPAAPQVCVHRGSLCYS